MPGFWLSLLLRLWFGVAVVAVVVVAVVVVVETL